MPVTWDIYIQDLPDVATANDIPPDFRPRPLGEREDLVRRIRAALPMADRQDSDWLFVQGPGIDLSMQFHMEDATEVRYILLHVHGGNDSAACVASLLQALELRALDTATGDFFKP